MKLRDIIPWLFLLAGIICILMNLSITAMICLYFSYLEKSKNDMFEAIEKIGNTTTIVSDTGKIMKTKCVVTKWMEWPECLNNLKDGEEYLVSSSDQVFALTYVEDFSGFTDELETMLIVNPDAVAIFPDSYKQYEGN